MNLVSSINFQSIIIFGIIGSLVVTALLVIINVVKQRSLLKSIKKAVKEAIKELEEEKAKDKVEEQNKDTINL
jgi:ABC-type transporter MlaC component